MGGAAGGMGGTGTMGPMGANPQIFRQMLQNPMIQQMLQNTARMLQELNSEQNPTVFMQELLNDPDVQRMIQSHPMLAQFFDPEFLRQVMQMMSSMGGGVAGGF